MASAQITVEHLRKFSDDVSEESSDRFVPFEQIELLKGKGRETTTSFSESIALASVDYPDMATTAIWLHCPEKLKLLTAPQVLAVHLIKFAHNEWFPISLKRSLVRQGFLLGDGPGKSEWSSFN